MRTFLFVCSIVSFGVFVVMASGVVNLRGSQIGSIFFVDSTTVKKIRAEFDTAKKGGEQIKVLIPFLTVLGAQWRRFRKNIIWKQVEGLGA